MPHLGHNSSKLRTQRKRKRQKGEEEEHRGSRRRKQLRMAGRESEISHILSLIAITRSPLKKTRWVLIPFIQEDQTFIPMSNVPVIFQDSRWLGILPMDSSIKFRSRIAASWKHFKKKGRGSSGLQKTVSVVNVDSIQARKRLQQRGRAQLQTRCFIEHAHEQMKHNQIKLDFLLHILPQLAKYNNSSYRAVGALLKCRWSGNWYWALDKILVCHVTCPGRGWGWGAQHLGEHCVAKTFQSNRRGSERLDSAVSRIIFWKYLQSTPS